MLVSKNILTLLTLLTLPQSVESTLKAALVINLLRRVLKCAEPQREWDWGGREGGAGG